MRRTKHVGGLFVLALVMGATVPTASAQSPATAENGAANLDARIAALVGRPNGLTADEVARRAVATSAELRAREHAVEAAASEVDQALVAWIPRLTATARYTRLSDIDQGAAGNVVVAPTAPVGLLAPGTPLASAPLAFPVILNQYLIQGSLMVPVSDYLLRTSQRYAGASRGKRAAELQTRAGRLETATNAKLAYYGWVRARLQQLVAEQSVEQGKAHLQVAQAALEAKHIARVDLLRVEAQLAKAELLVERADSMTELSEDRLRTLMHEPDATQYSVGEDLTEPVSTASQASVSALHAEALRRRPEIRALDETAWSLKEQGKVARAGAMPRLDGFANAYYANPNQRFFPQEEKFHFTWDAGVQLSWTPNDLATATAVAHGIDAKRAEIESQRAALGDALRAEVHDAWQQMKDARAAVRTGQRSLTAAEEEYRVRFELFQAGDATGAELTDAETELLRARLEQVNARVDVVVARVRLEHATGRDSR